MFKITELKFQFLNQRLIAMICCKFVENHVDSGIYATALRNHVRIVFEEMSAWTTLTLYLGLKTTF